MHGHLEAVDVVARLEAAIGEVASLPLAPLDAESLTRLLVACTGAGDRLTHATARVAVACEEGDLAGCDGSRHTGHWWARHTRLTRSDAGRRMHLARSLAGELGRPVADALAGGRVRTDQAEVVVRTLDELPDGLAAQTVVEVRARMIDLAAVHDAADLRRLGKRVLELIDPETYEHEEQRRLEAEEERAAATARFTMTHDGQGRVHGRSRSRCSTASCCATSCSRWPTRAGETSWVTGPATLPATGCPRPRGDRPGRRSPPYAWDRP